MGKLNQAEASLSKFILFWKELLGLALSLSSLSLSNTSHGMCTIEEGSPGMLASDVPSNAVFRDSKQGGVGPLLGSMILLEIMAAVALGCRARTA